MMGIIVDVNLKYEDDLEYNGKSWINILH